jgi:hypothetical protein
MTVPPSSTSDIFDMEKYMKSVALVESAGQAGAKASTSSASGLFQFTEGTWKQMVKEMGKDYTLSDRFDPKKSSEVMSYFTQKQRAQLEKGLGREVSNLDTYMAHFLGAGGATTFISGMEKDPQKLAKDLVSPEQVEKNKDIFYKRTGEARTSGEVYQLMGNKLAGAETGLAKGTYGGKSIPEAVTALAPNAGAGRGFAMPTSKVEVAVAPTTGQSIDTMSRPVVDRTSKPRVITIVNEVETILASMDSDDQMVFRDEYYDPKPQLVTR